jgi:hypothetical protein
MNLLKLIGGDTISKVVDRVLPKKISQEDRIKLEQEFEIELMNNDTKLESYKRDLIRAEAESEDKFVSRARPTFLYIVYIILVFNFIIVPIGNQLITFAALFLDKSSPEFYTVELPKDLYDLFKIVMLGYIGGRSWEKVKKALTSN